MHATRGCCQRNLRKRVLSAKLKKEFLEVCFLWLKGNESNQAPHGHVAMSLPIPGFCISSERASELRIWDFAPGSKLIDSSGCPCPSRVPIAGCPAPGPAWRCPRGAPNPSLSSLGRPTQERGLAGRGSMIVQYVEGMKLNFFPCSSYLCHSLSVTWF